MPTLRPYQNELVQRAIASLRAGRNPLVTLSTGGGKGQLIGAIVHHCMKHPQARVLILVHRETLVSQLSATLAQWGVPHVKLTAGGKTPEYQNCVIAMVPTAVRRRLKPYGLVIVDEHHHSTSTSHMRVIEAMGPDVRVLGLTATPCRLDGSGLGRPDGRAKHRKGVSDELIVGPSMQELTEQGWLAPLRCYAPDGDARKKFNKVKINAGDYIMADASRVQLSDPVKRYRELICEHPTNTKPAIAFCCTVEHGQQIAQVFRDAGIRAESVSGETPAAQRDMLLHKLGNDELDILTSCEVLGEGIDVPKCHGALLMRPTKSITVHMQQIGRVTRVAPGKPYAVVVDFVGRFYEFGDPYSPIPWSLDGRPEKQDEEAGVAPLRDCPGCGVLIPLGMRVCRYCEYEFPQAADTQEIHLVDKAVLIADFGHKPFETPSATIERVRAHFAGKLPESWPRGGSALLRWAQIADALLAKDNERATKLVREASFKTGFLWFMRKSLWEKRTNAETTLDTAAE